ncbi:FAD-dependent oxidoreductase-like enzyme [Grosmannia clavigera kw1407]|uniref:FAD-dependent oxidoreductase-like enzyme n=1 Tax=Grosmannia clavigera (strain kw1407 / UAMH 11150) TaxID=655863 RepID=F0XNQ1_GROCL|nr:FAD-dependent oxidoreductase-like enzyme [Grosmannia clavigera kw1407]EFX00526.1 FAD-dependent oxidoreductase-like enzyme [Grosmannia clavigera kw1407]
MSCGVNGFLQAEMDERDLAKSTVEVPSTPPPADVILTSQESILSTEGPGSPTDEDRCFRAELIDESNVVDLPAVISQTPPPSSQIQNHHQQRLPQLIHTGQNGQSTSASGYVSSSQRSAIPSPPVTGLNSASRDRRGSAASPFTMEYVPPSTSQIAAASSDELRAMLQASMGEHTRLKMETAHHKLQFNLLNLQADEDAKRAAVEHEMTRREVEALRQAESARQARRDLGGAIESSQAKYLQLKAAYDELVEENESLQKRVKLAKRLIQQKEEETVNLGDEKELLLNRLRENREHFHLLCSPGGMFHGAMTPKTNTSPVHTRGTPNQTPRAKTNNANSGRLARDHGAEPIAALLQALSQENNSAPNTPITGHRPTPRNVARHQRNVQSMSSLPTTPLGPSGRPRTGYSGLLPSADLVPQTEPATLRFNGHFGVPSLSASVGAKASTGRDRNPPETPTRHRHRLPDLQERDPSRESTISADEEAGSGHANEELARQAFELVAARTQAHQQSSASSFPRLSQPRAHAHAHTQSQPQSLSFFHSRPDDDVFESQASQAALAMLRRDARESFEVASSADDLRDGTPATSQGLAEKSAKLQARLFGGLNKVGATSVDKRKFSGAIGSGQGGVGSAGGAGSLDGHQLSPAKKVRVVPSLRDTDDSHRRHHHYQQEQRQQEQQQQQLPRVGLGIQYN